MFILCLSAFYFAVLASYFSSNSGRKVNQKNAARPVCPSGSRGIRLCLRAVLTRRPGSTGLNSTSLSNSPYQSRMPRQTSRGDRPPIKLRSLDEAQRNPGKSTSIESPGFHFVTSGLQCLHLGMKRAWNYTWNLTQRPQRRRGHKALLRYS